MDDDELQKMGDQDGTADPATTEAESQVEGPQDDTTQCVSPTELMIRRLRSAAAKAAAAKKRLMLDDLADAVIEIVDAIVETASAGAANRD